MKVSGKQTEPSRLGGQMSEVSVTTHWWHFILTEHDKIHCLNSGTRRPKFTMTAGTLPTQWQRAHCLNNDSRHTTYTMTAGTLPMQWQQTHCLNNDSRHHCEKVITQVELYSANLLRDCPGKAKAIICRGTSSQLINDDQGILCGWLKETAI